MTTPPTKEQVDAAIAKVREAGASPYWNTPTLWNEADVLADEVERLRERDKALVGDIGRLKACVLRYFEAVESGDGDCETETYELMLLVTPKKAGVI